MNNKDLNNLSKLTTRVLIKENENLNPQEEGQLNRYTVVVEEVFSDEFLVVAKSKEEAIRIAEDYYDSDMAGQDMRSRITEITPAKPEEINKGSHILAQGSSEVMDFEDAE